MICSEISTIEEIWNFNEKKEKEKVQNIVNNILNEYTKEDIYDVIIYKYGITDIWMYYIVESKFWENKVIQITFVSVFFLTILKLFFRR